MSLSLLSYSCFKTSCCSKCRWRINLSLTWEPQVLNENQCKMRHMCCQGGDRVEVEWEKEKSKSVGKWKWKRGQDDWGGNWVVVERGVHHSHRIQQDPSDHWACQVRAVLHRSCSYILELICIQFSTWKFTCRICQAKQVGPWHSNCTGPFQGLSIHCQCYKLLHNNCNHCSIQLVNPLLQ